jgi:WD40 repeat protein
MSDDTKTINTSDDSSTDEKSASSKPPLHQNGSPVDTRRPIEPSVKTTLPPIEQDARYDASRVPTITQDQYQMGQEFARGGMGRILRAVDLRIGREVAVKESLGASGKMLARFYREAMVTARLQHPGIVPIYELGHWPGGEPFYSMRFVKGLPLEDMIKEELPLHERIALLSPVISACEALAYAHSQKIVHRDLKPANILCGAFGETVVIDWGIAKDLQSSEPDIKDEEVVEEPSNRNANKTGSKSLTMAGAVMGTPIYMPPEQAHGLPIDERADVYSLGAILYEVLSGRPPYKGKTAQLILMDLIEKPPAPLATIQQGIPRDLVAIVEKAMSREAKDRYRNAGELANELRKFQTGQIVDAYRYSTWELIKRFVMRYLLTFIVGGVAALILAASLIYSYLQISEARDVAVEQSIGRAKEAVQLSIQLARTSLDTDPSQSLRYLKEASRSPYFDSWASLRTIASDALSRGVPRLLKGGAKSIEDAALSSDGSLLAAADEDGTVQVWQLPEGKLLSTLPPGEGERKAISFSPDHKLLAVSYGASVSLWAPDGAVRRTIDATSIVNALSFSPDGSQLALACQDGRLRLFETASGDSKRTLNSGAASLSRLSFSVDGSLLAAAGAGSVFVWESGREAILATLGTSQSEREIAALSFSADGKLLAAAHDKDIFLWRIDPSASVVEDVAEEACQGRVLSSGQRCAAVSSKGSLLFSAMDLKGHEWPVYSLAFSPDGETLATASEDRSVRIWKTKDCSAATCIPEILSKHKGSVLWVTFSADGRTLFSSSRDRTIRLWDMSTRKEAGVLLGHQGEVNKVFFSEKEQRVISVGDESSLFLWDMRQIGTRAFIGHSDAVFSLRFSPDGKTIVTASNDKTARLWDVSCGGGDFSLYCDKVSRVIELGASAWDVAFSSDGKLFYIALSDGTVAVWSAESGARVATMSGHEGDVYALDRSPDGALIASAGKDKTIRIWETSNHKQKIVLEGHTDSILDVSFSADQRYIASASQDGTVRVWDVASGKEVFQSRGAYHDQYSSICFSPDGRRVALAGYSSKIQLFSFSEGKLIAEQVLSMHQGEIERIIFSRDGDTLASASWDGTARFWDLKTNTESRALLSHGKDVTGVDISPDGSLFAFVSEDKQLHIAPNTLPTTKEALRAWIESLD